MKNACFCTSVGLIEPTGKIVGCEFLGMCGTGPMCYDPDFHDSFVDRRFKPQFLDYFHHGLWTETLALKPTLTDATCSVNTIGKCETSSSIVVDDLAVTSK